MTVAALSSSPPSFTATAGLLAVVLSCVVEEVVTSTCISLIESALLKARVSSAHDESDVEVLKINCCPSAESDVHKPPEAVSDSCANSVVASFDVVMDSSSPHLASSSCEMLLNMNDCKAGPFVEIGPSCCPTVMDIDDDDGGGGDVKPSHLSSSLFADNVALEKP